MKRSRRRRFVLLAIVGAPIAILLVLISYLAFGDLGRHRGLVENLVTDVLGRRLKIAGRFEPRLLSLTPSVVAEDVSLLNPDWSDEPSMVHVERLEGSIVLKSIFSGPIRIKDLQVEGAQVRLEVDGAGHASWDFDIPPSDRPRPEGEAVRPPIIFEQAILQDVDFSFRNLSKGGGIALDLQSARLDPENSGDYRVEIAGHVNGTPFDLAGRYGPVDEFILFKRAEYDLRGRMAQIEFAIAGQMSNLLKLDGSGSTVEVLGPEVADLTETFGLPSLGAGPFTLTASTVPNEDGVDVDLDATLGEVDLAAHGRMASLTSIDEMDLAIEGAGPDLGAFGAMLGAGELPAEPFQVSGRLRRSDGTTALDGVQALMGDDRLTVEGTIGQPPTMVGTDVAVSASGNDLSQLSSLLKIRLPEAAYEASGRLVRDDAALDLHDVRLRLGDSDLGADGTLTNPPRFSGSDLNVRASGPDLSVFSSLAGVQLPARSFDLGGSIKGGEEEFRFDSVRASLGRVKLVVDGSSPTLTDLDGVDVRVHVSGPDLAEVLALAGLDDLPSDPFEVDGRVRVSSGRYELTDVAGQVGQVSVTLGGAIAATEGLIGTDLTVAASGHDLSRLGMYASYEPLPADPFRVGGRVRVGRDGYHLESVAAEVGDLSGRAHGLVGSQATLEGSDLEIELRGQRLSEFAGFGDLPQLPDLPFEVTGRVAVVDGAYRLDSVGGALGATRFEIGGLLGPFPDLERTEVSLSASGPNLVDVVEAVEKATEKDLPDLPGEHFAVSGRVRVVDGRYELTDVETRLGETTLTAHGWVGALPDFHGTDLTLDGGGPQSAWIGEIAGVTLPDEPFRIAGRARWDEAGAWFQQVRADVGSHSLEVDGALGRPPEMVGTKLDLHISGPEPSLIKGILDLPRLPADPYEVAAHFVGTLDEFKLRDLRVTLGESDLAGDVTVDLRGKPNVRGVFASRQIDLRPLIPEELIEEVEGVSEAPVQKEVSASPEREASAGDKKRLVISDKPFDLSFLDGQNADIRLTIETLLSRRSHMFDFELRLKLTDGHLQIEPVSMKGKAGGTLTAAFDLDPLTDGYRLDARLDIDDARVDLLSYGDDRDQWPPIDIHFDLSGQGNSPRELAAGLNGYAVLDVGSGRLDPSILDLLAFDVMVQMLELLNPFRKDERFTEMKCAVLVGRFEDGRTDLEPLALQTDKLTVVGHGGINLENEKFDLQWRAKPRKGIGVSASAITNSYIKVGGTLGNPRVEMKPLEAATATGAAVATAGLSLVARGMWDRITADKKVCKHANKLLDEMKKELEAGGPGNRESK